MASREQMGAVIQVVTAIIDTVKEAGPAGAPGGIIYAAFMQGGMSLEVYERIMDIAVASGRITKRGDCYFPSVPATTVE